MADQDQVVALLTDIRDVLVANGERQERALQLSAVAVKRQRSALMLLVPLVLLLAGLSLVIMFR